VKQVGRFRRNPFVVARSEVEARQQLIPQFGSNVKIEQDPDVLIPGFLLVCGPFSTLVGLSKRRIWRFTTPPAPSLLALTSSFLGGADDDDGGTLYGTNALQGYIHGLVLDENGKKMSKTANNGINPLLLIDKYGTDALRYTLVKEVAVPVKISSTTVRRMNLLQYPQFC